MKTLRKLLAAGVSRHPAFAVQSVLTTDLGQRALRPLRAGMVSSRNPDYRVTEFTLSIREMVAETEKLPG